MKSIKSCITVDASKLTLKKGEKFAMSVNRTKPNQRRTSLATAYPVSFCHPHASEQSYKSFRFQSKREKVPWPFFIMISTTSVKETKGNGGVFLNKSRTDTRRNREGKIKTKKLKPHHTDDFPVIWSYKWYCCLQPGIMRRELFSIKQYKAIHKIISRSKVFKNDYIIKK